MTRSHACLILAALATPSLADDKITYDDDIFPVFESKCLNCHNPDKKKGDLDLSTYTGTMAGSSGGKVALAGDGGTSKLYTLTVQTEEPVMPPEGEKIAKKDADLIRAWIDAGLLENKGSKAKKRQKPAFTLGTVPTGEKPEGPPPMPKDLLLEPVVTPPRATVVADMEASPWAPLLAVTAPRQVLLYHTDTLELIGVLPFPKGSPQTLSFHPGGQYLLAGGGIGGKSGTTVTWDITTGEVLMTMGREFDSVLAADLRADLGGVALGGPSRLIKLWDTETGEQLKSIKKHTDWVTALAYSPDGVLLATGDRNNGVLIWEAATGNEFHSLRGHQKSITDLKWRADSNLVASASEDGTIRFWDMNQGKEIKRADAGSGVLALDYARDGRLISVGRDKRVKLWKPDLVLEQQAQPAAHLITEVAFSHNAARYFTADWDGRIEAWNTADLKKVAELSANPPSIATRLVTLAQEKETLGKKVEGLRQKNEAALSAVQQIRDKIAQSETTVATLHQETAALEKESRTLIAQVRQHEQKAAEKLREHDQLAGKTAPSEEEAARLKVLNDEHQALLRQKDETQKNHDRCSNDLQAKKARIPALQGQIPELRKTLVEREKLATTARTDLEAASAELPHYDARIKKWEAAAINTDLLQVQRELATLISEREQDPSLSPRIAELEKLRDSLAQKYQSAQ